MTRLLALALGAVAGVIAWLLWASSRDLRETWTVPPMPDPDDDVQWDPADDVQPADPVTFRYVPGYTMPLSPGYGTGDFWPNPWVNTSPNTGYPVTPVTGTLEPLTAADRDWLDQTVRSSLNPST